MFNFPGKGSNYAVNWFRNIIVSVVIKLKLFVETEQSSVLQLSSVVVFGLLSANT